jgi:hypothetical protein
MNEKLGQTKITTTRGNLIMKKFVKGLIVAGVLLAGGNMVQAEEITTVQTNQIKQNKVKTLNKKEREKVIQILEANYEKFNVLQGVNKDYVWTEQKTNYTWQGTSYSKVVSVKFTVKEGYEGSIYNAHVYNTELGNELMNVSKADRYESSHNPFANTVEINLYFIK